MPAARALRDLVRPPEGMMAVDLHDPHAPAAHIADRRKRGIRDDFGGPLVVDEAPFT